MTGKEWHNWWSSEEDHGGDTIEDVSQATWDAAIKFMEAKFTSNNKEITIETLQNKKCTILDT